MFARLEGNFKYTVFTNRLEIVLGNCVPIVQPNNLILLSPEQLIPPLELAWKQNHVHR